MNKQLLALHLERGRLLERIAQQRLTLVKQLQPLQKTSDAASRTTALVQAGIGYLYGHPWAVLAALSAAVLVRPHSAWRLLRRGLIVWRSWRTINGLIPEAARASLYKFIRRSYVKR